MKSDGVLFIPAFVQLLESDVVAALIFSQIAYWYRPSKSGHTKLRVFKKGHLWLARSAAHWKEELCLTEKQARRAVNVLESKGLIFTKVMRFSGSPTTHIRLTEHGHEVVHFHCGNLDSPLKTNGIAPKGSSITEISSKTSTENEPACEHANKAYEEDNAEEQIKKENQGKEKMGGKELPFPPVNALVEIWVKSMVAYYPQTTKAPTSKERGQLKQLANKVGERMPAAIDYAIKHWMRFSIDAQAIKGLAAVPLAPVVGFILAHYDVLLDLMKPTTQPPQQTYQKKTVVINPFVPEPPAVHTPEEIAATLAYFTKK